MKIPVSEPLLGTKTKQYLAECLDRNWISGGGDFVKRFEKKFAQYLGLRYAVTTPNGTTALHLALVTLGITKGDEVIISTFTMIAPLFAILYTGATPVLVDVNRDDWTMNISEIESKISKKTKAILCVHIYGHPIDMDPIIRLAYKYNLLVIEDAAEAMGATYKKRPVGSLADISCFSLYANKLVTSGEGGIVATNNLRLYKKLRLLKNMAHSPTKRFLHTEVGFNYQMTNMQAAVGLASLEDINNNIEKKRFIASAYSKLLNNVPGLTLPVEKSWATNVYWMYGIVIEKVFGIKRDTLRKLLARKGIETRDFFIPMHSQPVCIKMNMFHKARYPNADYISKNGLYLPTGLTLSLKQINYVCAIIKGIYGKLHSVRRKNANSGGSRQISAS